MANDHKILGVRLPPDMHLAFKIACVARGLDMSEVVRELIEQRLGEWSAEKADLQSLRLPETDEGGV